MPYHHLVFGDFLESLRLQDFSINAGHYLRLQKLLSRIAPECKPQDLKTILCPIFATNEREQERFYKQYDAFFDYGSSIESGTQVVEAVPVPEEAEKQDQESGKKKDRRALVIGVSIVTLIVAIVLLRFAATGPDPSSGNNSPTPTLEATVPTPPPGTLFLFRKFDVDPSTLVRALLALMPLLLFAMYELYRRIKERQRRQEENDRSQPGIPVRFGASLADVYDRDELTRLARLLRGRQLSGMLRLDILASVIATVRALGFFTLREKAVSKPPEYLVLIDRTAFRDHQARLFHELISKLKAEHVFVTCYYFEGDPRVSFIAPFEAAETAPVVRSAEAQQRLEEEAARSRRGVTLDELHDLYAAHRLLIFGEGTDLVDQVTLQTVDWIRNFAQWQDRAILTPRPPSLWDAHEFVLSQQFVVMPATLSGVELAAESFAIREPVSIPAELRGDPSQPPHDIDSAEDLPAVRAYLGERLFQWLCACAVHPQLQWDLTMCLGAQFSPRAAEREKERTSPESLFSEGNLLRLFSLPWFRVGTIPEVVRVRLMRELSARSETTVRQAIAELRKKAATFEMPLESSQVIRVPLPREFAGSVPSQLFQRVRSLRDSAFQRFLQPEPVVLLLKSKLPTWLQQLLFTPFGLRAGVRVALVVLVSLLVWATFPTLASALKIGERTTINANVNTNVNTDSNSNFPPNGNVTNVNSNQNANVGPSPVNSFSPAASPSQTLRPSPSASLAPSSPSPSRAPSSPSPVATASFSPSPLVSPTISIASPTATSTPTPTPISTPPPSPVPSVASDAGIFQFDLDRSTIQPGERATLSFDARSVIRLRITPSDDSDVAAWNRRFAQSSTPQNFDGHARVEPLTSTTYTITASVVDRPELPSFRTVSRQITLRVVERPPVGSEGPCRPFDSQLNALQDISVTVYIERSCSSATRERWTLDIIYGSPKSEGAVSYNRTAVADYEVNAIRKLATNGLPESFNQMMRRDVYPVLKKGNTTMSRKKLQGAVISLLSGK